MPGRGGRTGAARPTLLVSSLLRSIRARVRDSIRDIIPRSGGRGASGARGGTQASDCGGGGGGPGAPHASVGDRKSDSPRPAPAPVPQTESPPPGAGRGGGAEQGGCPRGRRRGRAGAAGELRGAAGRLRVPGAPGPGDAPRGSGLLTATPRPPFPRPQPSRRSPPRPQLSREPATGSFLAPRRIKAGRAQTPFTTGGRVGRGRGSLGEPKA